MSDWFITVAGEPTSLEAVISESNSSHVNVTVSWESPADPVTGYVIYYQTKGGPVISDMVSGGETETHSLDGLQRGVTYYISILALSQHLPSPLVGNVTVVGESFPSPSSHHVLLSLDPLLVVETSPESLTTSPNTQFSLNCTIRTVVDGENASLNIFLDIEWLRIDPSSASPEVVSSTLYTITRVQKGGYLSVLTTAENDTVNNVTYRCTANSLYFSETTISLHKVGKFHLLTIRHASYQHKTFYFTYIYIYYFT